MYSDFGQVLRPDGTPVIEANFEIYVCDTIEKRRAFHVTRLIF